MATSANEMQNITVRLRRDILRKAKVLAARRDTSISGLLAQQLEKLVVEDDSYERAKKRALEFLNQGFDMGDVPRLNRDELHER